MATFIDRRTKAQRGADVHVFKTDSSRAARLQVVNPAFFGDVVAIELVADERGSGAVLTFKGGGRLDVFRGCDLLWVEPATARSRRRPCRWPTSSPRTSKPAPTIP